MARKFRIAVGLLFLAVFLTSVFAVPLAAAQSPLPKQLRVRVVKRTAEYVIVTRSHPNLRLKLYKGQRYTNVRGHQYQIVKRSQSFITLQAKPRKPKTQPTAPVAPTPTPTDEPTPTPTVTPTVEPTVAPVPSPGTTHPQLILVQSDLNAIRSRVEAGQEPQASAWAVFLSGRVASALSASPEVYAGPVTSGGVGTTLELALDKDGSAARNLALAYALTGDVTYASKAREYLMAWASGNTPTTFADSGDKWAGSYQSHGAFMFAYAYDLAHSSDVFSAADVTTIEDWFRRFVDALDTYNTQLRSEWVITNPGYELPYAWDATRHYNVYDNYVGGDMALLQQAARLAMARVIGYTDAVDGILSDPSNILGLDSMSRASLEPRNDGVGIAGHPASIPQVNMYKKPIAGRGGTLDYMTYNTRVDAVLLELAENAGWNGTTLRGRLKTSWDYLARFFGPNAEPSFVPGDVPMTSVDLPRFALAYQAFGDARYLDILNSGNRASYYEPQLLGPVTLTHSIVH